MKHVLESKAKKVGVGAGNVLEYGLGDSDIDIAIATISGSYPGDGFVVNEEIKELLYVLSGSGKLITKDSSVELNIGDQVLIEKGEFFKYADCDNLVIAAACTPAWTPKQHKKIST